MRMYDLIMKKRQGGELTSAEINGLISGFVAGEIPDYQMSAFLMAVLWRGMTKGETAKFTLAMMESGDKLDLSAVKGRTVDKHSTGGVGDKTTLVVLPLVAACGGKIAKLSGRGLGHTGGTLDKLDALPGFSTAMSQADFLRIVNQCGCVVAGQSGNFVPADKKMYALRDVTATVDSIPLIAASIMSKKLAAGSQDIVLDVKVGSGAFMKNRPDAKALAQTMVDIGERAGRRVTALITDMEVPLGRSVGNSLELAEAYRVLMGEGAADITELSITLAAEMLALTKGGSVDSRCQEARDALDSGAALAKMLEWHIAQGGWRDYRDLWESAPKDGALAEALLAKLPSASHAEELAADVSGFVTRLDALACGKAACLLGAGRVTKDSPVDLAAGLELNKQYGDFVAKGEVWGRLYTNNPATLEEARSSLKDAITIAADKPPVRKLICARVTSDGIEEY